jgi:hypothetical protein
MISVTWATSDDLPWLLEQTKAFSDCYASQIPLYPGDDHARQLLRTLMSHHVMFVARQDGTPIGFIAGMLVGHPMNPTITVLSELLWWVAPDHRGSRAGALLLDAYTNYGKSHAQWVTCSLEAHTKVNPKSLEKRGYRLNEYSFFLEVL